MSVTDLRRLRDGAFDVLDSLLEARSVPIDGQLVEAELTRGIGSLDDPHRRACALYGKLLALRGRPVRLHVLDDAQLDRVDGAVAALLVAELVGTLELDLESVTDRVLLAVRTASDPRFGGVYFDLDPGLIVVDSLERTTMPRRNPR